MTHLPRMFMQLHILCFGLCDCLSLQCFVPWIKHVFPVCRLNRLISQMQAPLAVCREPATKFWQLSKVMYVFENKAQYLLIRAPFARIVVFWHIGNAPQWSRRVKYVVIPPRFVWQQYLWNIAIQPAVGCYNSWANLCSSCSPLGEKSLWNGTIFGKSILNK